MFFIWCILLTLRVLPWHWQCSCFMRALHEQVHPYRFMCKYGYKLSKVRSHLFPPEFLLNFNTAFHSMGPRYIRTLSPFSDCVSATSFSWCTHPGDGDWNLCHFQHMTWVNPKSQSYYCLPPFLHWRLGSHYLKCRPHMSNAVFVSLLAHSWMSSAGEYRSVLLPATVGMLLCISVTLWLIKL